MNRLGLIVIFSCIYFSLWAQIQMPVYSVTSYRPAQGGSEAGNTIDGNVSTTYHSRWNLNAIPDTLTFYFNGLVPEINNIKYVPRQEGGNNGMWEKIDILVATRTNPEQFRKLNTVPIEWAVNNEIKNWDFPQKVEDPYAVKIAINQAAGNFSSCAEMEFYGSKPVRPDGSIDCDIELKGLNIVRDTKIPISKNGSYASSYQPGENIDKSFDGNQNTLYHSAWDKAYTALPVELTYHFDKLTDLDYLIYYPRKEGYNGFFGQTAIYYLDEAEQDYVHLLDYDFGMNGLDTRVNFPKQVQTYEVRIVVKSGEQGFVSCAEMEFYKKSDNNGQQAYPFSNIFTSPLYDQLHKDVSTIDIADMEPGFYKSLASCLLTGNYNVSLRSRQYNALESLSQLSRKLKTSRYDAYENPTGILFSKSDTIVIFADSIGVTPVYLRVKDFANEDNPDDYSYQLSNGLNIIEMRGNGLGYISYFDNQPEEQPEIKLNIVNGTINGYFDVSKHNANDWIDLMSRNVYKKVDLLGKYVHLNYDRTPLKIYSPYDGTHLMEVYDSIVQWQRIQMGLYRYNYNIRNRMFGESGTGGGYYAGGQGIHLDLTWGPASIAQADRLDMWGIPHEFGHVNQIRPGLRWIGTTEVTNNVYAVWANYHLNREYVPYSRLEAERFEVNGSPSRVMNRMNGIINELYLADSHIQETKSDYPFRVLVPFWQLQLYYQLAGACRDGLPLTYEEHPTTDAIDYAHWYGYVAEKVRNTDESGMSNGRLLLNFIINACDAVQEDLTDLFIRMGMLRAVDTVIDDYGEGRLAITQEDADQVINQIRTKYAQKPISPVIHYISALTADTYRNKAKLTGKNGEGYILYQNQDKPYMEISHATWKNSVAFETYAINDTLLQSTLTGTGDLNNQKTLVPLLNGTERVYAVGYDGSKILVWPKTVSVIHTENTKKLKVFPNPVFKNTSVHIEADGMDGICNVTIYNTSGTIVFQHTGSLITINNALDNTTFSTSGMYYLRLNNNANTFETRFICLEQ